MSLYDWVATNPELLPLYTAYLLILLAWAYWSTRKLFRWGASITAGYSRGDILPPDDLTNEIALFMVVLAVDMVLIGGYLYLVT